MFATGASGFRTSSSSKPYTAITVHVERLTSETYEEDDVVGIPDLIEVIKLQATGPAEAARALRKKLKYGSVHRQMRALTILDGVLQNAGPRVQKPMLADGPLLERLRIAALDHASDPDVRKKCKELFGQWVASSQFNPGLEGAKSLYNQLPRKTKTPQQRREQSKVLKQTEEQARHDAEEDDLPNARHSRGQSLGGGEASTPPSHGRKTSSANPLTLAAASTFGTKDTHSTGKKVKKDKKTKGKVFNLEKERPAILQTIAASSVASTNLNNALKFVNREQKRVSEDTEVMKRFETCKQLRRQILRYIQFIDSEEFLGGLIHANEELVEGLMLFEVLDKSVDDDSDSEMEEAQHLSRQEARREEAALADANRRIAGMSLDNNGHTNSAAVPIKPPRPNSISVPRPGMSSPQTSRSAMKAREIEHGSDLESASSDDGYGDDDNEDDPFGDRNAARTPEPGKNASGFSWKEV